MYLTIISEYRPNHTNPVYHYGISKSIGGHYIKIGSTCELRTVNEDYKVKLTRSQADIGRVIKLEDNIII